MKISKENVDRIAFLARLKFNDDQKDHFTTQLNIILEFMEQLGKVNTSNVEPTFQATGRINIFREDLTKPSLGQDSSLSNAPDRNQGFFRVPKIIG